MKKRNQGEGNPPVNGPGAEPPAEELRKAEEARIAAWTHPFI